MSQRIVIVGGGIVGGSAALYCDRKGWNVTLLERSTLGSGASTAAAGILSPPFFLDPEKTSQQQNTQPLLSRKGYDFYPEFLDVLGEYTDPDIGYNNSGMWYLAFDEDGYDEKKTMVREMEKFNRPAQWANRNDLLSELPFLSDSVKGGFLFEEEAQVVPGKLIQTLKESLSVSGTRLKEQTVVQSLQSNPSGTVTVQTDDGSVDASAVLVAAGYSTPQILHKQSITLPIEPRKGQMLKLEAPNLGGHPPVRRGDWFVLPRDGNVIVGSTVEDIGESHRSTAGAIRRLLNAGQNIIPSLNDCSFLDAWAGLRPYAAMKGGPFLGKVSKDSSIYFAAGHYKTGILQGPFTGKLMADYISGLDTELEVERYHPDRRRDN
jgi:glycine oxidase